MVLLPVLSTILVLSIQSTSTATILKADDVEIIAGLVLYRVERGEIRYVLLQKADELDDWSVPKGQIDEGEDIGLGAMRECFEETGYQPQDYSVFFDNRIDFEYTTNDDILKKVSLFPAKLTSLDKPVLMDPKEHASFDWLKDSAASFIIKHQYRDAFEEAHEFIVAYENL